MSDIYKNKKHAYGYIHKHIAFPKKKLSLIIDILIECTKHLLLKVDKT